MKPVEPKIHPNQYLTYLKDMWNPKNAADALGCSVAEIRALQRSEVFVEQFMLETLGLTGPMSMRHLDYSTLRDLLDRDKLSIYNAMLEIAMDNEANPSARLRALTKLFDKAADNEGISQKHELNTTVTHKLDPESAKALEEAKRESSRLISAPVDITPEEG